MSDQNRNNPSDEDSQGRTVHHLGDSGDGDEKRIPTLLTIRGRNIGDIFEIYPPGLTIGRTMENDIFINDPKISRAHAKLLVEETDEERPPKVVLVDLGSTNGVFVNDEKITEVVLKEGDKVALGATILRFNHQDNTDMRYQSQIKNLINIDNLTGLLTKRSFDLSFEHALIESKNHKNKVSILMMDLDHFKNVNDAHDHLFGSYVLHEVGKIIKKQIDPHGISGRYGGEEFVSFLPVKNKTRAKAIAEELRLAIADYLFEKDNDTLHITISIGVSTFPEDGELPDDLIQKADHALYRAKANGRNMVCLAGKEDN